VQREMRDRPLGCLALRQVDDDREPSGIRCEVDSRCEEMAGRAVEPADLVLARLAVGARVVICGTASVANWDPPPLGPRVERHILVKRARMAGLIVFDYQHRYEEAVARLASWVRDGRLTYREDIVDGIEHCPGAIAEIYRGENLGKRLIRLRAG